MAQSTSHCNHILTSGKFCQSPALRDDDYCYFHRASRERHKRHLRHTRQVKPLQIAPLEDEESIQLAIGDVLNALLAQRIDHRTAGLLLYGLQTAASNARKCHFDVYESDERVVRYTEYEQRTLDEEVEDEIRQEERLAERARRKAAKQAAAEAAQTSNTVSPDETAEPETPARPDPGTVLPEKKPATHVSQKEFWSVVGTVAKQNAVAAALQLEKQLCAMDEASQYLEYTDEEPAPPDPA